jgi:phosphatidylglycerophosphate synthase
MIAQVLLIAALAASVALSGAGLGAPGWIAGLACGAIMNSALARGLSHYRSDRLSPADWVTLARATLAVGVAALVADSFSQPVPGAIVVSVTALALALDAVDGWVARRTRTMGLLGARFDGEVDAFLILVLSIYVARSAGAWVLAIGAARYAFLAAGWPLRWMRAELPPRFWRKVVAATQGIVLAIASAHVLPRPVADAALGGALILLAESFGRDVWWLRGHRPVTQSGPPADADLGRVTSAGPGPGHRRARTGIATALTVLALLFVWGALVAPDQPLRLEPEALLRLPLEGFILIAAAAVLPARARRVMVWVVGPLLGMVVLVKILNIGFFAAFDRPFDAYQDVSYAGIGAETLRDSIGHAKGNLVIALVLVFLVALLLLMTLAVRRLTRIAAGHRPWTIRAVAGLGAVWLLCWAFGAHFVSKTPIASTSAAGVVVEQVRALRADLRDHATFAKEIGHDRFAATPANRLLTALRGKDVLLAFVESYGKSAVQGSSFSPQIDAILNRGTGQLAAAGFSARSAFLTSPTFGGISWLAHSTMQSGVWVKSRRRYAQLTASNRFTLSDAFKRAGWRTVDEVPSNNRFWAPGKTFYHYDRVYDRRDVGYRGPTFAYASMPDQYVLAALQRLELAKRHRRPLFAELDLVSSHTPWTRIPRMIPWSRLGDGSIFNRIPVKHTSRDSLSLNAAWAWLGKNGSAPVRAAYSQSIQYTLNALISFVQHYRDPNLVMIMLGDHQPWTIVSGQQPSHEVPISVIAHDPAVLKRIARWGFDNGLRPSPKAPVWPMSAFRDRFLSAFGSQPAIR